MAVRRVAVIAYHSSPVLEPGSGDAGGMTVYVRELAHALARRGVATDIFTRATADLERIFHLDQGVRVVALEAGPRHPLAKESLGAYVDDFVLATRAFATAQRASYDVVHSHYWQSGLAAKDLAGAWGVPMVHSHHTLGRVKNGSLPPGDEPEPSHRLEGESEVIEGADVLIAATDDEWQQLSCLYGASHDRLKTIHPGVDHSKFFPGDRGVARRKLGLDGFVLLFAGRIQALKGIELAIRALEQLRSSLDRPATLLVVGGASGRRGLEETERLHSIVRQLGLDDAVRFVGPRPHAELPDFYRAADAVVVCSHSESFGLAALEAHACGTPVVGTAVGGLSYVVKDGVSGFLVDTRDPSVFAARLKALFSDDHLQAAFRAASAESARAFSWDMSADTMLELYECLVREQMPEACTC